MDLQTSFSSYLIATKIMTQPIPRKHSKFYFNDSLIAIQVENTLFNVHKSQLLKSGTFKDMFSIGKHTTATGNGKCTISGEGSEENPIKLAGVRVDDFEKLLTVLYALHYSNEKPSEDGSVMIPALRLANMWDFSELRGLLIPIAEKTLNDVAKIVYAREFGVAEWLVPAHVRLCQRGTSLTKEEATKVGFNSLLIISHLREKHHVGEITNYSSYCVRCSQTTTRTKNKKHAYPMWGSTIPQDIPQVSAEAVPSVCQLEKAVETWIDSGFESLE